MLVSPLKHRDATFAGRGVCGKHRQNQNSSFSQAPDSPAVQDIAAITEDDMGTVRKNIFTKAQPADVWEVIADVGALHTRPVPGFVTMTRLGAGARIVTFANGMVVVSWGNPILARAPATLGAGI
jgi:hypothetical protein